MIRALLLLACTVAFGAVFGADAGTSRYDLRLAGRGSSASWVVPFNKQYAELSPEQRATFKSQYERMDEEDEPPFPLAGLRAIYEPIVKAQSRILIEGDFLAEVRVNSDGEVTEILVARSPSKAVTDFVSGVVFLTKFKPALCQGVPCAMGFPVRVGFKLE